MTTNARTDFVLQLLQKVGAPLTAAVARHASGNEQTDAKTLALLLSETVRMSITLTQAMSLKTEDGDAESIRVALAKLAAGLVAQSYVSTGRTPGEAEGTKLCKLLESVIVFSDNFAPGQEHAKRLKMLDSTPPFFDPVQTNLYAMHALLPVITVIAEFSFGQPETKLIQDVAGRLQNEANKILENLNIAPGAPNDLIVLQALAQIYADAHRTEIQTLKQNADSRAPSLDHVWEAFSLQKAMVEVLLGGMGASAVSQGASGGAAPQSPASQPETPPPAAPQAAAGGSPMSFFKKK